MYFGGIKKSLNLSLHETEAEGSSLILPKTLYGPTFIGV